MNDAEDEIDAKPTAKKTCRQDDGGEGKEKEKTKMLNYFQFGLNFNRQKIHARTTSICMYVCTNECMCVCMGT